MSANKLQQTAWHTSAAVSSAPLIELLTSDYESIDQNSSCGGL